MPGERVELPRDHWIVLRDPWEVTEKERRPVQAAFIEVGRKSAETQAASAPGGDASASPQPGGEPPSAVADSVAERIETMSAFSDRMLAFFIVEWDLDLPITPESMGELPFPLYDAIDDAVAPLVSVLFPQLAKKKATTEDDGTDASPTTP